MVEYALLLGMSTGIVIAGLWYFISAGYHKKVFDFWSEPLGKSVEVEVPGEGE